MLASSLIGLLCGLLLGSRFKVFSLVLAQALAIMVAIGFAAWTDSSVSAALLALLCWSICLQIGYVTMVGVGVKAGRALQPTPSRA